MKTILKVLYIVVIGIMTVVIYFGMNSSFVSQNYIDLLKEADKTATETKNYDDLARCFSLFSTPIDKEKVIFADQNGENAMSVYASVNQFDAKFKNEGKTTEVHRIEKVYLFIIHNPKFQYSDSSNGTNPTCLRFYGDGDENKYFDYYFSVSSSVNASVFKPEASNEKDGSLYAERHLTTDYIPYNLIFFPIAESHIKYIKEEKNITEITGINVIDNGNNKVYKDSDFSINNKLDFSQAFYSDMAKWLDVVNTYNNYDPEKTDITQEDYSAAKAYLEGFVENPNDYVPDFDQKYIRGIAYGQVYTGASLLFKCIGVCLIFVLVAALIYVVLFHLKAIRGFVKRFSKKAVAERNIPNKMPKQQVVISKNSVKKETVSSNAPKNEVKEEVTEVEEKKEETTVDTVNDDNTKETSNEDNKDNE